MSANKLRHDSKKLIQKSFVDYWRNNIRDQQGRLEFYSKHKHTFEFEEYLNIVCFSKRKVLTKLRCSDHELEIERGRHKKVPREARLCKLCAMEKIETEEHFLFECKYYEDIRKDIKFDNKNGCLFSTDTAVRTGEFILLALAKRKKQFEL